MSIYGYEIKNCVDYFRKLLDEREDFLKNPTSSRHAMNCALTSWHLHEWIFKEYLEHFFLNGIENIEMFRKSLYTQCQSLLTVKDLANGSKHFLLTKPSSIISTEKKIAGTKLSFKTTLQEPTLIVTTKFDSASLHMTFDDLLYEITFFWYVYLAKELKINTEIIFQGYTSF